MGRPVSAPGAVRRKGVTRQQDETEEKHRAAPAERALTLSIGTLGAATLDGPPYSWSFVKRDQGESLYHGIKFLPLFNVLKGVPRRRSRAETVATLRWHRKSCEGIEILPSFDRFVFSRRKSPNGRTCEFYCVYDISASNSNPLARLHAYPLSRS